MADSEKLKNFIVPVYLLVVGILLLCSVLNFGTYDRFLKDGGDGWGYYIYLPSTLIYHDIETLDSIASIRKDFTPHSIQEGINSLGFYEVNMAENGNPVIKYTSGVALMMSPFFVISHGWSILTNRETSGFTSVYWLGHYLGIVFWVLAGLWFLIALLRCYFNLATSLITSTAIVFATNLYYFTVYNPMAHAPLFALYCLLIYFSDRFYKEPGYGSAILIGMSAGLITMIRPVELIAVLIPLLWVIKSVKSRLDFFKRHYRYLLVSILFFGLMAVPQLLYWKVVTDNWLFYSYGEEGFNFLKSRFWNGMTSFQNGWLVYTPLMIFVFPGIYFLYKKHRSLIWPLLAFIPIHIYIVYSWHNWYYINSFGSRPMVEAYALLSLPLAAFIHQMFKNRWSSYAICLGLLFFIWLNIFQTWQVSKGMLLTEEGNRHYYMAIFGQIEMRERILIMADTKEFQPLPQNLRFLSKLKKYDMSETEGLKRALENDRTMEVVLLPANEGVQLRMDVPTEGLESGDYLKIKVKSKSGGWNGDRWGMATQSVSFIKDSEAYKHRWNRINNKLGNESWNLWGGGPDVWGEAWFFVKIPDQFHPSDDITTYVENKGHVSVWVGDIVVEYWTSQR